MAFSSFCPSQDLTRNFSVPSNVPLDIAIRHAPEIPHTSLWPVLEHILDCPHKWESGYLLTYEGADSSSGVWISLLLIFCCMDLKIKWPYEHCSF